VAFTENAAAQQHPAEPESNGLVSWPLKLLRRKSPGNRENPTTVEIRPMWTKPDYTEMRYGFEVTMYFASR
jgi:coenzyme PQQ precursor peptide PqqA